MLVDGSEEQEETCPSISPHGNLCELIPDHKGRHQINHIMGEEDWDDNGHTNYSPAF